MEITARKKSNDPIQEALRAHKDKWNLAAKEFIARVIAFKRALNGRGDAHYSLPPSNIKDAFPDQIASFLSTLSSNYEQLASEALRIEQEQSAYSQSRTKSQPKVPGAPAPSGPPKVAMASARNAEIQIAGHKLTTLLAITAEEQEVGLMNRPWPPPVMSFVYSSPRVNRFWMKNTPSPLDIVFALNGKVISICKGEPHSTAMIGNYELSDLVVELPFGTCTKLGVKIGDEIGLLKSVNNLSSTLESKYYSSFDDNF